jgi:trehalose utilization protein
MVKGKRCAENPGEVRVAKPGPVRPFDGGGEHMALRVTVWNEYRHERHNKRIRAIYPEGIHSVIADYLRSQGHEVRTATLDEPEHGLTDEVLANTDVLTWWGHGAHREVSDAVVAKVHERVLAGMGLIVLHSGHFSKIFRRLMGTTCNLKWREIGEKERIWVVEPGHPIAAGLPQYFEIPNEEMYGERFDVPAPDALVLISWFPGGEVFRSGCCYYRGNGRIFYFRPGHESFPTYCQPEVQQVIGNAVKWAAPVNGPTPVYGESQPLERV